MSVSLACWTYFHSKRSGPRPRAIKYNNIYQRPLICLSVSLSQCCPLLLDSNGCWKKDFLYDFLRNTCTVNDVTLFQKKIPYIYSSLYGNENEKEVWNPKPLILVNNHDYSKLNDLISEVSSVCGQKKRILPGCFLRGFCPWKKPTNTCRTSRFITDYSSLVYVPKLLVQSL